MIEAWAVVHLRGERETGRAAVEAVFRSEREALAFVAIAHGRSAHYQSSLYLVVAKTMVPDTFAFDGA